MSENKDNKTAIYAQFPKWHWLLPFSNAQHLSAFLNKRIGSNDEVSETERFEFVQRLFESFSLDTGEKDRVLREFSNLSRYQFDALLGTWQDEKDTFANKISEDAHGDLEKLFRKSLFEWSVILEKTTTFIALLADFEKRQEQLYQNDYEARILLSAAQEFDDPQLFHSLVTDVLNARVISNEDGLKSILNSYFHSGVAQKYISPNEFTSLIDLVDKQAPLSDESKAFLKSCLILYLAQQNGFNFLYDENRLSFVESFMDEHEDHPDICRMISWAHFNSNQNKKSISTSFDWLIRSFDSLLSSDEENTTIRDIIEKNSHRDRALTNIFFFVAFNVIFSNDSTEHEAAAREMIVHFYDTISTIELPNNIPRTKFYMHNISYILAMEHVIGRYPISNSLKGKIDNLDDDFAAILRNRNRVNIGSNEFGRSFRNIKNEEDKFKIALVLIFIWRGSQNPDLKSRLQSDLIELIDGAFKNLDVKSLITRLESEYYDFGKIIRKQSKNFVKR